MPEDIAGDPYQQSEAFNRALTMSAGINHWNITMCNRTTTKTDTVLHLPITAELAAVVAIAAKEEFTTKAGLVRRLLVAELRRRGHDLKKAVAA